MTVYATRRDLATYGGIAPGTLSNEGRSVAASTASTDVLELAEHGFVTDDPISFRAIDTGTLSEPLVQGTTYYAIRLNDSTFKVAATVGGAAINLTTDGSDMLVATPLPVDELLELYSRWVDAFLPAHLVPLTSPFPIVVVAMVARLAAKALMDRDGKSSELVNAAELAAKAQLERWARGIPLRDTTATASANLAIVVSMESTADGRGWGSGSLP